MKTTLTTLILGLGVAAFSGAVQAQPTDGENQNGRPGWGRFNQERPQWGRGERPEQPRGRRDGMGRARQGDEGSTCEQCGRALQGKPEIAGRRGPRGFERPMAGRQNGNRWGQQGSKAQGEPQWQGMRGQRGPAFGPGARRGQNQIGRGEVDRPTRGPAWRQGGRPGPRQYAMRGPRAGMRQSPVGPGPGARTNGLGRQGAPVDRDEVAPRRRGFGGPSGDVAPMRRGPGGPEGRLERGPRGRGPEGRGPWWNREAPESDKDE